MYYVVQCGQSDHPNCGVTHIWYYDQPSDKWCIKDGTSFETLGEAERVAFSLAIKGDAQIGRVCVVREQERVWQ
jgi:hypothetical protein